MAKIQVRFKPAFVKEIFHKNCWNPADRGKHNSPTIPADRLEYKECPYCGQRTPENQTKQEQEYLQSCNSSLQVLFYV